MLYIRYKILTEAVWLGVFISFGCSQLPTIDTQPITSAAPGEQYKYRAHATGDPEIAWHAPQKPSGLEVAVQDPHGAFITWTPIDEGDYEIEIVASNSAGSDSQRFTVKVQHPDGYKDGYDHGQLLTAGKTDSWAVLEYLKSTLSPTLIEPFGSGFMAALGQELGATGWPLMLSAINSDKWSDGYNKGKSVGSGETILEQVVSTYTQITNLPKADCFAWEGGFVHGYSAASSTESRSGAIAALNALRAARSTSR